jgi:hypothetical protein
MHSDIFVCLKTSVRITATLRLFTLSSELAKLHDCTLLRITKLKLDGKEDRGENGKHQEKKRYVKRREGKVQYNVEKE